MFVTYYLLPSQYEAVSLYKILPFLSKRQVLLPRIKQGSQVSSAVLDKCWYNVHRPGLECPHVLYCQLWDSWEVVVSLEGGAPE